MPHHVVELVSDGLNQNGHAVKGSKVLLCGVAYKKDINDIRESPALDVMKLLEEDGAEVEYYDPNVSEISWNGGMKSGLENLSAETVTSFQAVIILADHSNVDYPLISDNADLIIDTRNVYSDINAENIIRLGVGRKK
jgi:UDP-N-acetyl-D-glucosamine dehydrogenase